MKNEFYVFQEDLIQFNIEANNITLSEFVQIINKAFCREGMKKLRVETITKFLCARNMLHVNDKGKIIPTTKGNLWGITEEMRMTEEKEEYRVNIYSKRMLIYLLDNLYNII